MSSVNVVISRITEVLPHNNADSLGIYKLEGLDWQVVASLGQFEVDNRVVYFPPDTVLSREVAQILGVEKYLSFTTTDRYLTPDELEKIKAVRESGPGDFSSYAADWGRVRAIKLRQEPSFGFLAPIDHELVLWAQSVYPDEPLVGLNVSGYYGAKQYQPPGPGERGYKTIPADGVARPSFVVKYTDIENLRNHPNKLDGKTVVITEKIHGTCTQLVRHRYTDPDGTEHTDWYAGCGKGLLRKMPETEEERAKNLYWRIFDDHFVQELFAGIQGAVVILFGETFGPVQKLTYNYSQPTFRMFDIWRDGEFMDWPFVMAAGHGFGVPVVPELYRGPFSLDLVRGLACGSTTINGANHIREGVVVHPLLEETDEKGNRLIFKYINPEYLTGKLAEDEVGE